MSAGNEGGDKPASTGPGVGQRAVETPVRIKIRNESSTPGESVAISAADTAMALARDMGTSESGELAPTEAAARTNSGRMKAYADDDAPQLADMIGTTLLGRYHITRKIGQGGMGAVFEATHTLIGKRLAVKVLLDKYARRDSIVRRLEQEARLASSIGHEHIIDITDFGTTEDGRTFVVMEFLEGESLADCLHRVGVLPEQRILKIAQQIASALGAAHAKGIVHRDVKPENVFLLQRRDTDFIKVVDFGISKSMRASDTGTKEEEQIRLTQTGMVLGTPLYMSPEQARGDEDLDHRIDVYAVGVIMYELATGRVPFLGTNYLSVISQVLNDVPKPPRELRPELSDEFEAIVLRALAKNKAERYQSTEEMITDLSALIDDPTHSTERARITGPRRQPKHRRFRTFAVIGGSIAIAALAVIAVMMMMGPGSAPAGATASDAATAVAGGGDAAPRADALEAAILTFKIVSIPPGATLYEDSRQHCDRTPCDYVAPANTDKITLVAHLDGYDDAEFSIIPLVDKKRAKGMVITVPLQKPKRGPPKVIIKKPPDPGKTGAGGGDIGTNPYPQ